MDAVLTHYGVLVFAGDFDDDHPDPELRGHGPSIMLLAAGDEDHCWAAVARWTSTHPLRRDETAEVVSRDPVLAVQQQVAARCYRDSPPPDGS